MSERPDDPDARQQRLDALRSLAHDAPAAPAATDATPRESHAKKRDPLTAARPKRRPSTARTLWRRWRAPALAIVAAMVIFGAVIGAILQNSGLRPGPKPPPALVGSVIALSAAGSLSCPSAPVWSPDGKQLAVYAVVGPSPGRCWDYNDLTNIQRFDQSNGGDTTTTGTPPTSYAIIIFDASSDHVARVITLPELTNKLLCAGADPCSIDGATAPQSLDWSPDGQTIAVFAMYTFDLSDNTHFQDRGLLITAPVDGSAAPRALIAKGRTRLDFTSHPIGLDNIYSAPRFVWDLTTGTATAHDIQRGQWPMDVPFAAGYRLGTDGALTIDQKAQAGDVTPWRVGVFNLYGPQGKLPTVSYQSSQWLWSADGRYVLPDLNTAAYLGIVGITSTPPADNSGLIPRPTLTTTDAATRQALRASGSAHSMAGLARNPDGKLLAALLCAPSGAGQLTIRSVASGKTLAQTNYSYPLTSTSLGCTGDLSPIAWSPDGAHIAASDSPDGQIIVWRVNLRG